MTWRQILTLDSPLLVQQFSYFETFVTFYVENNSETLSAFAYFKNEDDKLDINQKYIQFQKYLIPKAKIVPAQAHFLQLLSK